MNRDLSNYQKAEDFQKYIDENNIESPADFKKKDSSLFRKVSRLGLSYSLIYKKKRIAKKRNNEINKIKTIEDFQNFITKNDIKTSKEFRTKYNSLYQRAIRLGVKNFLVFNETHFWRKLTDYEKLEDFQKFVEKNEILSPQDFKKFDAPLYKKASKLKFCDKIIYVKRNFSLSEINILKTLEENKLNYEAQKTFNWLKSKIQLKLDFYLPEYNIAIECQGKQHFMPNNYFGGENRFNEDVLRDKIKHDLCKAHNIKIIYFVDLSTDNFFGIEFDNYLDVVFTSTSDLLTFIKNYKNEN